jgi:hypothetical protein
MYCEICEQGNNKKRFFKGINNILFNVITLLYN